MQKSTIISAVTVVAALVGGTIWYFADGQYLTAKLAVSERMNDPSSVRFRNLYRSDAGFICGEYNAKNSYGAYVGFQQFSYNGYARLPLRESDFYSAPYIARDNNAQIRQECRRNTNT